MAREASDIVRDALGNVVREALKNAGGATPSPMKKKSGPLTGARGVATGVGLAAAAPLAKKGFDLARGNGHMPSVGKMPAQLASKAGDRVADKVKQTVSTKVDQAGGAGGIAKDAVGGLLPGGGGGEDEAEGHKGGTPGVGKGRRMPIQQSVDVAVPLETAYNQFSQFEEWPQFMHRVTNVTQDDECTIKFSTKIWGKTKEFEAKIITQRPDERIKWRVAQGITHSGVVSFHELAPALTRIELTMDVDPGSLIEKFARGSRHIKRAVRADLHRFKAFIEMLEVETGAWRGRIEDGEVVEEHDDSYDKDRDYSDVEDLYEEEQKFSEEESDDEDSDDDSEQDGNGNGGNPEHRERFKRQAEATRQSSSSRSPSSSSSGGRSSRSGGSSAKSSSSRGSGSSSKSSSGSSKSSGGSAKRSSSRSSGSSSRSSSRGSSSSSSSSGGGKRKPATRRKSTSKS